VTPVIGGLAAVVLVAGGFIGGVEVQKGRQDGGAGTAGAGFAARLAQQQQQPGPGGGAAQSTATAGTVKNTRGGTLYVTTTDGTTVRVQAKTGVTVTRKASSHAAAVHPGDTVVVEGTQKSDGTIAATSIAATAKGAATAGAPAALGSQLPPGFSAPDP
jgi:hypothetical protein